MEMSEAIQRSEINDGVIDPNPAKKQNFNDEIRDGSLEIITEKSKEAFEDNLNIKQEEVLLDMDSDSNEILHRSAFSF